MTDLTLRQLLIATNNSNKVREIAQLLADSRLQLYSLKDFPQATEVEEIGLTFAENALLKAHGYAAQTGLCTLADDSGLEVEALAGKPGVLSARYGGDDASDAQRCARLLAEVAQSNSLERRARFVCVIAITDPVAQASKTWTGICEGYLANEARGTNGFGYDPIFVPTGYTQTFGELPSEIKQQISHRARALETVRNDLSGTFMKFCLTLNEPSR